MLGYLSAVSDEGSEYVVVDLVTGARTEFAEVGDGRSFDEMLTDQRYFSSGQAPGFWSPDNQWLALAGAGAVNSSEPGPLLLGVDGEVRELGVGTWPVGWLGSDRLTLLTPRGELKTVDVDGQVLQRATLEVPDGYEVFGQWSGLLSPDGSRIAVGSDLVTNEVGYGTSHQVSIHDTATGQLLETIPWQVGLAESCGLAWRDGRVLAGPTTVSSSTSPPVTR